MTRVLILGQVVLSRPGEDASVSDALSPSIVALVQSADVVFANIDAAFSTPERGHEVRSDHSLSHVVPASALQWVRDTLKVNVVSLSNNHIVDYGVAGLHNAHLACERYSLQCAGVGQTLDAACHFVQHGQVRVVAMSTYSPPRSDTVVFTSSDATRLAQQPQLEGPSVNILRVNRHGRVSLTDAARNMDAIAHARAAAAPGEAESAGSARRLVIAYHHVHHPTVADGQPPDWQRQLARDCISAGADVYVSNGEARLHPYERISDRGVAFYNIGNFVFRTRRPASSYSPDAWEGVVVDVTTRDKGQSDVTVHPIVLNRETGLPEEHGRTIHV
jgi:poly-gamma-glutamate capsule biosynthesis protein CapA/YwtB (metallophosphatase superfamily)